MWTNSAKAICAASRNGKYGYISKAGKPEIDFMYDEAEAFENNVALVKKNGKALLINRDGEPLFAALHEDLAHRMKTSLSFWTAENSDMQT
jgi:hypothetical protein